MYIFQSSLVAQWVKDLALSLLWLRSLLWHRLDPWPREFPHAVGAVKKKKERERKFFPFPFECGLDLTCFQRRGKIWKGKNSNFNMKKTWQTPSSPSDKTLHITNEMNILCTPGYDMKGTSLLWLFFPKTHNPGLKHQINSIWGTYYKTLQKSKLSRSQKRRLRNYQRGPEKT